jgi:hypothetical protein
MFDGQIRRSEVSTLEHPLIGKPGRITVGQCEPRIRATDITD